LAFKSTLSSLLELQTEKKNIETIHTALTHINVVLLSLGWSLTRSLSHSDTNSKSISCKEYIVNQHTNTQTQTHKHTNTNTQTQTQTHKHKHTYTNIHIQTSRKSEVVFARYISPMACSCCRLPQIFFVQAHAACLPSTFLPLPVGVHQTVCTWRMTMTSKKEFERKIFSDIFSHLTLPNHLCFDKLRQQQRRRWQASLVQSSLENLFSKQLLEFLFNKQFFSLGIFIFKNAGRFILCDSLNLFFFIIIRPVEYFQ